MGAAGIMKEVHSCILVGGFGVWRASELREEITRVVYGVWERAS